MSAFRSKDISLLKLAIITDDLTCVCLAQECKVMSVTPWNWRAVFSLWRPDILFVESAWTGHRASWKYGIAAYPDYPERTNTKLARVVAAARNAGIPAIFWNREDGVHFERFIDSAKLFDRVLTVDENMIPRYRAALGPDAQLDVMIFAASPALHSPSMQEPARRAAFVGSYSSEVHTARGVWQNAMFEAAELIGITAYDRNSGRMPAHYRYPDRPWMEVRQAVPHSKTADIYRSHAINLNVNTITDSSSAFSRRLVEILACGSLALTNPTPAVTKLFGDYCVVTDCAEEAKELFARIACDGLSKPERDQAKAGAEYVRKHHTWHHRLEQILQMTA